MIEIDQLLIFQAKKEDIFFLDPPFNQVPNLPCVWYLENFLYTWFDNAIAIAIAIAIAVYKGGIFANKSDYLSEREQGDQIKMYLVRIL